MGMTGTLEDMRLSDLLDIIQYGHRTGVLSIACETNRSQSGVIFFANGHPIDAAILSTGSGEIHASGEDALVRLLRWTAGRFAFRNSATTINRAVRITRNAAELRTAAARGYANGALQVVDTEARFALTTTQQDPQKVRLSIDQWRVMSQIATGQTFGELVQAFNGMPQTRIAAVVSSLVKAGLVVQLPITTPLIEHAVGAV